jgi:hypothetical protein
MKQIRVLLDVENEINDKYPFTDTKLIEAYLASCLRRFRTLPTTQQNISLEQNT